MAKFDPVMYSKNVLRSAGYIGVETIKGVNPSLTNLITESIGATKEMYSTTKDFIKNPTMAIKDYIGEEAAKSAGDVKHNILDDIRTGKFYNPDRQRSDMNANMSDLLGFNFDDLDLDVDEDYGEERSEKGTPQRSIENLSITQQKLTQASTDTIVKNANANTTRTLTQQAKMMGVLNGSLSSINTSILNLHNAIAKPLDAHIQNSTSFYKTTTELMAKQTSYLENINKLLTQQVNKETSEQARMRQKRGKSTPWQDVMGGGFNPSAFFGHIKNNVLERTIVNQFKDVLDPEMIKMMRASGLFSSPIAMISTMVLTNYLQNGPIGDALGRTESIINNGLTNGFMRIHDYRKKNKFKRINKKTGRLEEVNKNPILGFLADIFDIVPDKGFRPSIKGSTVPYKGPTQWTGLNDKALQEVIPTQLAEIISLLSGNEPEIYNYNTGKFQRASNISRQFRKGRKENISNTADKLRNDFLGDYISDKNKNGERVGYNTRYVRNVADEYNTFVSLVTMRGYNVANLTGTQLSKLAEDFRRRGLISKESVQVFKKYLFTGKHESTLRATLMNAQASDRDYLNNGGYDSTFNTVVAAGLTSNEDSWKKPGDKAKGKNAKLNPMINPLMQKDDKGNDVYFYLQNYYHQLDYIIHRIETGNFGGMQTFGGNNDDSFISYKNYTAKNAHKINNRSKALNGLTVKAKSYNEQSNEWKKKHSNDVWDSSNREYKKTGLLETYGTDNRRNRSGGFISEIIESANDRLERIFFGTNPTRDDRNYGILGPLKDISEKVNLFVEETKNFFKEWLKKKWNQFKEGEFWQRFTGQYRKVGRDLKNRFTSAARIGWNRLSDQDPNNLIDNAVARINNAPGTAAHGGMVTKSGMVSVSEGEMIIPSEMNPYYHGKTNKYSQKFNEKQNYNKWRRATGGRSRLPYWGSYAKGGTVSEDTTIGETIRAKIEQLKNTGRSAREIAIIINRMFGKKVHRDLTSDVMEIVAGLEDNARRFGSTVKNGVSGFEDTYIADTIKRSVMEATKNIQEPIKAFIGDTKKNAGEYGSEVMRVLKEQFPETMATGSMGALIGGALTGSGIGLLGGFVIGAGVNILKESDTVSRFLFGGYDKNGEWKDGKVPPELVKTIKEKAPKVLKSGALGSILGAIGVMPGGIIGGAAVAATLQILQNNDSIRESLETALFGEAGVDGQRRGGIIGSIRVRVIDPLADFVKDKLDGFDKYFKENFINPLLKIFKPMSDWIAGKGIKMLDGVGKVLSRAAKDSFSSLGTLFDATVGRVLGFGTGSAKKLINLAGTAASLPFRAVGKAADAWDIHNIKAGYSTRSAIERVDMMDKAGKKTSAYNRALARLERSKDKKGADQLILDTDFYARGLDSANREAEGHRRETRNKIIASLTSGGIGKNGQALGREIHRKMRSKDAVAGDFTDVLNYINGLSSDDMSDDNKKRVAELLSSETDYIKSHNERVSDYGQKRSDFFKRVYGIDIKADVSDRKAEKILAKYGLKDQAYTDRRRVDKETTAKYYNDIKRENALEKLRTENPLEGDTNKQLHILVDAVTGIKKSVDESNPAMNAMANATTNSKEFKDVYKSFRANGLNPADAKKKAKEQFGISDDEQSKPKDGDTKYENGMMYEFRSGKWELDLSDGNTKEAYDEERKEKQENRTFRSRLMSIIPGITAFFGGKKKDEGNGEKKETFFDKIKNFFGGVKDFVVKNILPIAGLGWLFGTDTGQKVAGKIGEWINNNAETIGSAIGNVLGSAINWIGNNIHDIMDTLGKIGKAIADVVGPEIKKLLENIKIPGLPGYDVSDPDSPTSDYHPDNPGATEEDKKKTHEETLEREKKGGFFNKLTNFRNTIDTYANMIMGKKMTTYDKDDYIDERLTTRIGKQMLFNTAIRGGVPAVDAATKLLAGRGLAGKVASAVLNPVGTVSNIGKSAAEFGGKIANSGVVKTARSLAGKVGNVVTSAGSKLLNFAEGGSKAMQYGMKAGVVQTAAGHVYNAGSKVAEVGSNVASAVLSKVSAGVNAVLEKVFWALGKPMPEGIGGRLSEAVSKALESAKGFASKAGAFLQAAGKVLYFANIANAVTEGLQSAGAKVILGIVAEPTLGQRILAAICNGLNAAIPLIGGLIPTEVLVNIIYAVLNPFIDFGDFEKQREAAAQELKEYNEANGTNYSLKEYLYHYYGEATIQTKVSMAAGQAWDATKTAVTNAGKAIGDTVGGAWNAVKTGAGNAWEATKNFASNTWESAKTTASNIVDSGKQAVSNIFGKVSAGKDYVMEVVTSITNLRNKMQHTIDSGNFDIKTILNQKLELNKNNPLYSLANTASGVIRTVVAGTVIVPYIGKTIFGNVTAGNKNPIEGAIDTVKNMISYVGEGNVAKLMAAGTEGITGQSQNGIAGNIGAMAVGALLTPVKLALVIPTGLKGILNIITEKLETNNINVGNPIEGAINTVKSMLDYVAAGDVPGLMGAGITDQNANTGILGRIGSAATGVLLAPIKMALVIPTGLKGIFNSITDKFASDKGINLDEMKKKLDEFKDPSKPMSEYDTIVEDYKKKAGDGIGSIGSKIAVSITAWIHKIPITISRAIKSAFGFFDGGFDKFKEWLLGGDADVNGGNSALDNKIKNTTINSTTGEKMADYTRRESIGDREGVGLTIDNSNTLKRKEHNTNSWYTLDAGEYDLASGSGIHVRQEGRERYGGSTLADVGCGPAAAATVLRSYGKRANLRSAANYARNRGYEVGGASGTKAGYFNDVFAANGIKSSYVTGSNISNAVSSGRPTVLLGQDRSNNSKANSPFGPNPHYVVASGTDRHGNVFIDDPELRTTALYKKDILKNASLGIATGGKSGTGSSADEKTSNKTTKYNLAAMDDSSSIGIGSNTSNNSGLPKAANNAEAIWGYYKSLGLSDEAVAGILGNVKGESGGNYNPKTVEHLFVNHLSGKSGGKWITPGNIYKDYGVDVSSYDRVYETYTQALDNKKISLDEFQHPYKEYVTKTGDSSYKSDKSKTGHEWLQYGYGLVGFTDPGLKAELYNATVEKGKSISDLGSQLDVLTNQLRACGVWDKISNNNITAQKAAEHMLMDYEKPSNASDHIGTRGSYALDFLNQYRGKNFDISGYVSGMPSANSSNAGTKVPEFHKYQLNDSQIRGIANILGNEQGSTNYRGLYAEASLMANLLEKKYGEAATVDQLVSWLRLPPKKEVKKGEPYNWFAKGRDRYDAGSSGGGNAVTSQSIQAATDVFVEGHRTFPRYIDEHDMLGKPGQTDIDHITDLNGNSAGDKFNKNNYIPHQTVVHQGSSVGSGKWTFFNFPDGVDGHCDPFGYASKNLYEKYKDDGFYQVDKNGNISIGQMGTNSTGFTDSNVYTANSDATSSSNEAKDIGSIISKFFGTIFKGVVDAVSGPAKSLLKVIFGISDEKEQSNTSNTTTGENSISTEGNTDQEAAIVKAMVDLTGKLRYGQGNDKYPLPRQDFRDGGSGDCSSTVGHVLSVGVPGLNLEGIDTDGIWTSSKGRTVDKPDKAPSSSKDHSGSGPHIDKLRPGDALLYKHSNSKATGHVELYLGDNKRSGHGGGVGPKITPVTDDGGRYLGARRFTTSTLTTTNSNSTSNAVVNSSANNVSSSSSITYGDYNSVINGFPYYNQGVEPWKSTSYGTFGGEHKTLGGSGCGPTSMAMVMKSYGINVTPKDVADYALAKGFYKGNGTDRGLYASVGTANGLTVSPEIAGNDRATVESYLKQGIPLVNSQTKGHFAQGRHIISIVGIDNNGNYYVNDPSWENGRKRSLHSWKPEEVYKLSNYFYAVSKNGEGSIGNSKYGNKELTPTEPSIDGSNRPGGSSGLPLYDFTGGVSGAMDMMQASNRLQRSITTNNSTQNYKPMDYNEIYNNMLKLLAQIAANTTNNSYLPTIVELIKELGNIMGAMNNSGGTTTVVAEDKRNQINQDLSRIMAKIDEMTMSL